MGGNRALVKSKVDKSGEAEDEGAGEINIDAQKEVASIQQVRSCCLNQAMSSYTGANFSDEGVFILTQLR